MFHHTYRVLNEILLVRTAFVANYHYFQTLTRLPVAPVLKANAYGHGLLPMARVADRLQAPYLCVDSLYEAYELRKAHVKTPILILGYTFPENYHTLRHLPFTFAVYDSETIAALGKQQPHAIIHLKLDTGMCRLGIQPDEIPSIIKALKQYPNLRIEGIFSHLSQADNPAKKSFSIDQINRFKQMVAEFETAGFHFTHKHIAATSGASWLHDPYFTFSRVGLGLYGYSHLGPSDNLHPVLEWISHIASIKTVAPKNEVGYGGTYQTKSSESLAVIPAGYAEGIDRHLSNAGSIMVNKIACPIVGNVCMDMTIIKLPNDDTSKIGDPVTIISRDQNSTCSVYAIAKTLHTIPYTVLTGLHPSIRRTIVDTMDR